MKAAWTRRGRIGEPHLVRKPHRERDYFAKLIFDDRVERDKFEIDFDILGCWTRDRHRFNHINIAMFERELPARKIG